jgi:hypothetical protein
MLPADPASGRRPTTGVTEATAGEQGRSGRVVCNVNSLVSGSPVVKKGRHRRFEEARKLKQSGPGAFDLGFGDRSRDQANEEDEYAALAEKYGVTFEDDDDTED